MDWIDIEYEKPKYDSLYLIFIPVEDLDKSIITTAWYNPNKKEWSLIPLLLTGFISHWMELPEHPNIVNK